MGLFFTLPPISDYTSLFSLQRKITQRRAEIREEKTKQLPLTFFLLYSQIPAGQVSAKVSKGKRVAPVCSRIQLSSWGQQSSNIRTGLNKLLGIKYSGSFCSFLEVKATSAF